MALVTIHFLLITRLSIRGSIPNASSRFSGNVENSLNPVSLRDDFRVDASFIDLTNKGLLSTAAFRLQFSLRLPSRWEWERLRPGFCAHDPFLTQGGAVIFLRSI